MLITKLTLNNFRVFRGVHEVDLRPAPAILTKKGPVEGTERPIILFGGLNGAGKTSILTAVRLALFGRQAFDKVLTNVEYVGALTDLIHKGVGVGAVQDQASIELEFTYNQHGENSTYKIIRSWQRDKKDTLSLDKDGNALQELNYEQCQGFLTELIPTGIADLFFFDGEKIAELAEDESGIVLKTAVRRLLGLDVISKLKSDLNIFLKKHGVGDLSSSIKNEIEKLDNQRMAHEHNAEKSRSEADFNAARIELTTREILNLENRLSQNGGAWAKSREEEKSKIDDLLKEKIELEQIIRKEMESSLPFSLAPNAMKKLLEQIQKEQEIKTKLNFENQLDAFLTTLCSKYPSFDTEQAQNAISDSFKAHVGDFDVTDLHLDISDRQANTIDFQINDQSNSSFSYFDKARKRLKIVENIIDNLANNIARAPEQEQIQKLVSDISELIKKKECLISQYKDNLESAKRELRSAIECARQIQKLHDKHKDQANKHHSVDNAQNAISLLNKFSEQLTKARVKQLQNEFIISYQKLARKEDLQLTAEINSTTFDVELKDEYGIKINRKAMSAGEKQIYAISILEALGRTSGRKLPIIIDTPLGRLDSHHRDKLIENYFPTASHQVIILSTDTEIDKNYINLIQDDIARTYEIIFDGKSKSSNLKKGYFWKENIKEAV